MKTKAIGYSYPTSANAVRFKFPKGCYTVDTIKGVDPPVAVAAFATFAEAKAHAETHVKLIDLPWNRYTLQERK